MFFFFFFFVTNIKNLRLWNWHCALNYILFRFLGREDPGSGRSTREGIGYPLQYSWASLGAQLVKNTPAMRETWVQSLGWEDPLEKGRLPTPVFWPGEFHGVAKSRTRLNNFIFTVNRGFRKMMLLQKFEINFYSIISHSFHVIQWQPYIHGHIFFTLSSTMYLGRQKV